MEKLELCPSLGWNFRLFCQILGDLRILWKPWELIAILGVELVVVGSELVDLEAFMEILASGRDTYTPLGKQTLEIPPKIPKKSQLKASFPPAVQLRR